MSGPPPIPDRTQRLGGLFEDIRAEMRAMHLEVALLRDARLTEAEQVAVLEVYQEFGR